MCKRNFFISYGPILNGKLNWIKIRSDSEDEDDDDELDGRLEDLIDDNPIEDDNSDAEDSDRSGST